MIYDPTKIDELRQTLRIADQVPQPYVRGFYVGAVELKSRLSSRLMLWQSIDQPFRGLLFCLSAKLHINERNLLRTWQRANKERNKLRKRKQEEYGESQKSKGLTFDDYA
jgi:hypothetical protein